MPAERVETLVIGGGQAGLTMSHCLKQRGMSHLVLGTCLPRVTEFGVLV